MLVRGKMALPATVLLSFAALICLLPSDFVQADYIFEVTIQSYSNPTNREADGDCCDDIFGDCNDDCEPYYNLICLRPFGHSHGDLSTCSLGSFNTEIFNIPRTVSIAGTEPWPASFQLYIEVFDEDLNDDDLLDRIFADTSRPVSNQFSSTQSFTGDFGWVTLGLSFRVQCAPGWTGSDCDECVPATGCSRGFCNEPGQCICNSGWTGSLCDECIPADGCSPVGGFCNQPGECVCNPDWAGPLCDQCTLATECCSGQYECSDGECITAFSVECDGISHCDDGSDESDENCPDDDDESFFNGNAIIAVVVAGIVAIVMVLVACICCCLLCACCLSGNCKVDNFCPKCDCKWDDFCPKCDCKLDDLCPKCDCHCDDVVEAIAKCCCPKCHCSGNDCSCELPCGFKCGF